MSNRPSIGVGPLLIRLANGRHLTKGQLGELVHSGYAHFDTNGNPHLTALGRAMIQPAPTTTGSYHAGKKGEQTMPLTMRRYTHDELRQRREQLFAELRVHEYLDTPEIKDFDTLEGYELQGLLDYDDLTRYDEISGINYLLGED